MEEIRGRVQQLLSQGWGLATAPLYRNALFFGSITGFLNSLLGTRVLIRNQTRPLIVSGIISSTVTLGFGYVLLSWGGITGLAAATVIGSLSQIPYLYLVARRSFGSEGARPVDAV